MVKVREVKAAKWIAPTVAAAVLVVAGYAWIQGQAGTSAAGSAAAAPAPASARRTATASESPLPVIGYDRVVGERPADPGLGRRDLFDFPTPPPTPTPEPLPQPVEVAPVTVPTPPPLPPLNIKYIGAVERRGVKVAMLLTDKKEVLTGQVGEVVGNRFKIVKIGLESLDIQDVGGGAVRRIPLKGN